MTRKLHKKIISGFTLIELLVVIAIIGLLASIVFASLNVVRAKARDARRIVNIAEIKKALEIYFNQYNVLPVPSTYGEGNSSPGYWDGWWDVSSGDGDGDGKYFLDFLEESGIMSKVPLDPLNTPATNGFPTDAGYRYVYFVVPVGYAYNGGSCVVNSGNVYMLAIADLETESSRPPINFQNSGCPCLWKDTPNFFQSNFDYITCGTF